MGRWNKLKKITEKNEKRGAPMANVGGKISILLKDDHLNTLHGRKKMQHILAYYKFPLIVLCIFLYAIGYILYGHFTHKNIILYTALVNVVAGEDLTRQLGTDYVDYLNLDTSKNELQLYTGLYLTDDELNAYHEYTYASRMKILATIDGEVMDVVLMNREAFDAFSQKGYLCDLDELLSRESPVFYESVKAYLAENILILEDNSIDVQWDSSIPYSAVTEESFFGLDLSQAEPIRQAGFDETVYLGIIANSPRKEAAVAYLEYLFAESGD